MRWWMERLSARYSSLSSALNYLARDIDDFFRSGRLQLSLFVKERKLYGDLLFFSYEYFYTKTVHLHVEFRFLIRSRVLKSAM